MKTRTLAIRWLSTLALLCLTVCARGQIGEPAGAGEKSSSAYPKGSYWDGISTEYPTCAGLVAKHYAMTQQLEEIFGRARSTPAPKQSAVVDEMNKLAKERNDVARQIQECVKQSSKTRCKCKCRPLAESQADKSCTAQSFLFLAIQTRRGRIRGSARNGSFDLLLLRSFSKLIRTWDFVFLSNRIIERSVQSPIRF